MLASRKLAKMGIKMREAIVLAGGLGTRLRATVPDLPKAMAPVNGQPFMEILLSLLEKKGIRRVVISVGYLSDMIIEHFGKSFNGIEIDYCVETELLGTGGAILAAFEKCQSDNILVLNGDTYIDVEQHIIEKFYLKTNSPSMVVKFVENTSKFGKVEISDDLVTKFCGKNIVGSGYINVGFYFLNKNQFLGFEPNKRFSFEEDFLPKKIGNIAMHAHETDADLIDIGTPHGFKLINQINPK